MPVVVIRHAFGAYVSMPHIPSVTWPFAPTILETDNPLPKPAAGFQGVVATMSHTTSLVRRLAELRRSYTGETCSPLMPAVTHACKLLGRDERLLLAHGLDRHFVGRLLGHDDAEPLPADLRAAVLPEAGSACQRELEADVLLAAGRAVANLHPLPELAKQLSLKPGRVFRMLRSQPDGMMLHLERAVLGPLLLELLPRVTADGSLAGVPGLRAVLHRRHIELYSLYTTASVTLANLSYRQWTAGLAFAEVAAGEHEQSKLLRWLGNDPTPLHELELAAIIAKPREAGLLRTTSAVLRRAGLWAEAQNLQTDELQPNALHLRWHAGPTAAEVATALVHPITGLYGDRFFVVPQAKTVTVHSLVDDVSVVLEQVYEDIAPTAPPTPELVAAWKAWDDWMRKPNPHWGTSVFAPRVEDGDVNQKVSAS